MPRPDYPITPGVRLLRAKQIAFEPRLYDWEEPGGTGPAAAKLGVDEHGVIKTLVMEADGVPILVLMHGDRAVSTRNLARAIGAKHVAPCAVEAAQKHTGYQVGGISPFGTRRTMPVYVEATILALPRILVNGGKRGFLVELATADLARALPLHAVSVAVAE